MNLSLILLIDAPNLTCPALECGVNAAVAIQLKTASVPKSRDGSGWLIGTIAAADRYCNEKWRYAFSIPESEVSPEVATAQETLEAGDVASVCCLECGDEMLLAKLKARTVTNFTSESFRLFDDTEPIANGSLRLFRRHSTILIHAIEASCEAHVSGYPYAAEPQPIELSFLASPSQQAGPFTDLGADPLIIDPASATPLTGRVSFVPALEIPGGSAFAVNVNCPDPDQHLGLEVHVDYEVGAIDS